MLIITSSTYDKNGNLLEATNENGAKTTYTYDNLDRVLSITTPGQDEYTRHVSITTSKEYDYKGNVTKETDAKGNITTYIYSPKGNLEKIVKTTNNEGAITEYITAYAYDVAGRKTIEVSPGHYNSASPLIEQNRVEYTYDKMGRMLTKNDIYKDGEAASWSTITKSFTYDALGNVIKSVDGMGYESTISYNLDGQVAAKTDPERNTVKYSYDGLGRVASETKADGSVTTNYYNDAGKVIKQTIRKSSADTAYTLVSNVYDFAGNLIESTNGNGNISIFTYNAFNKVRTATYPGDETIDESIVATQYDKKGNIARIQDSMGTVKLYTYDEQNRVLTTATQDIEGKYKIMTSIRYDKNGNQRFIKDGNGNITEKVYNELGQVVKEISPLGQAMTYTYDKNGNLIQKTDWLGNSITSVYDPLNRLIEQKSPMDEVIVKKEYNNNHIETASIDGKGNKISYTYDRNNRLLSTTDQVGNTTRQAYDKVGNVSSTTDGEWNNTTYKYDFLGRLISVTNAKGEITTYTYDLMGNLLTQTDGNGNTATKEYNARNLLAKSIDPNGMDVGLDGSEIYDMNKVETYTYYSNGLLKEKKDKNGNITKNTYDVFGRLLKTTCGEDTVSYTYDNNGNTKTVVDATGTTVRTYDKLGRVTLKSIPKVGVMTYKYDVTEGLEAGYKAEISTDAKGNTATKVFDQLGRLKTVISDGNSTTTFTYDLNGNKESTNYSDGSKVDYTYYNNNQLHTLTNTKANGAIIDTHSYTYDHAGNQLTKTEKAGTTTYGYDCLNRLEKVLEPDGIGRSYLYDAAGNRLKEIIVKGSSIDQTTYTYNEQNRLLQTQIKSAAGAIETTKFTYDANGNQTYASKELLKPTSPDSKASFGMFIVGQTMPEDNPIAGYQRSYKYNKFNQMIYAANGGTVSEFTYNGEGLRASSKVNGKVTKYIYEGDKVVLELNDKGKQSANNVYGDNQLISRTAGSEKANYFFNGHGDVTALVNSQGTVIATYQYDAFGNPKEKTGQADNPFRYAGYQYDEGTQLYYLKARMYDPVTARFMQEDSYLGKGNDPLSLNRYTYCHNNPVRYWDPTGHWVEGDETLNSEAKAVIIDLTISYYAAKSEQERTKLHNYAEAIRNNPNNQATANSGNQASKSTNVVNPKKNIQIFSANGSSSNLSEEVVARSRNFYKNMNPTGEITKCNTKEVPVVTLKVISEIFEKLMTPQPKAGGGLGISAEKGKGHLGYQDSTLELIMKLEGDPFLTPRINADGSITIGYGYDFTEKSDPVMFNKYLTKDSNGNIVVKSTITDNEAKDTIKLAADKKGITKALDNFISGKGAGNTIKPLALNQNQYDALFSYFYSNGPSVFTDSKYNEWMNYGGEYATRAQARIDLRDYIIKNNGNYDDQTVVDLFINSKGANIKYTYEKRRRTEANLFTK